MSDAPIDSRPARWPWSILAGFLVAAGIAGAGLVLALLVLPAAGRFLPRLREAPQAVTMH